MTQRDQRPTIIQTAAMAALFGLSGLLTGCARPPVLTGPLGPDGPAPLTPEGQPAPWRPGIDGPRPQPADGTPAVPFVVTDSDQGNMRMLVRASRMADAATADQPTKTPGPGRRVSRAQTTLRSDATDRVTSGAGVRGPEAALAPWVVPSLTIEGPDKGDVPYFPPDPMGDAGPSQYVLTINGRIRIYARDTGAMQYDLHPDAFFPDATRGGGRTGDPRVRFDRHAQRWVVVYFTTGMPNRIVVAFSNTAVITDATTWTYQFFANTVTTTDGQPCFADYPTLGIDRHALFIGVNQFCGSTYQFFTSSGFVVRKPSGVGASTSVVVFSPLMHPSTYEGIVTPQGVDVHDVASTGYFIGTDASQFGRLGIVQISYSDTSTPIASRIGLDVDATSMPVNVPFPGGQAPLDSIDDRLMNAVMRGGQLYAAHAIGVTPAGTVHGTGEARSAVRWYQISMQGTQPRIQQFGTIFDTAASNPVHAWLPSIAVNRSGTVLVSYAVGGTSLAPGARVSYRLASDPAGTMRTAVPIVDGAEVPYHPYTPLYGYHRWGDYTMTSVDPVDGEQFWTVQMYLKSAHRYGTRALRLSATAAPSVTLTADRTDIPAAGGMVTLSVATASAGTAWTLSGMPSWLSAPSVRGSGHGAVTLTVTRTASAFPRTATLQVAGRTVTLTQAGDVPVFTTDMASWTAAADGATQPVLVISTLADAPWTADTSAPWLSWDRTSGTGSTSVPLVLRAAANPDVSRTATATIGGRTITVTQASGVRAPSNLRVDTVSGTWVTLEWDWLGEPVNGFLVSGGLAPGQSLGLIPVASGSRRLTLPLPRGRYWVRVHALTDLSRQYPSNEVPVIVGEVEAPSAPANLLASVAGQQLDLAWTNTFGGGVPTGVRLHVSGSLQAVVSLPAGEQTSLGAIPDGTYTLRLEALNRAGGSQLSPPVTITVPSRGCTTVPEPPAWVRLTEEQGRVTVSWAPARSGAAPTSYELRVRGTISGDYAVGAVRSVQGTLPPGQVSVGVVALNSCGGSVPTAPVRIEVPESGHAAQTVTSTTAGREEN